MPDTAERVKAAAALALFASENKHPGAAAAGPAAEDVQGCGECLYFQVKHYPALFWPCFVSSSLLKTHARTHSHTPGFTESVIMSSLGE